MEERAGTHPVTLKSEQVYNKLMNSPRFTDKEKQVMTRIRNTKMTPRMRAVLLGRSGLTRKVANMLGINKTVFQTPNARMRIANNIYTRVSTKKITVKPIAELSQKDLDASTSLLVLRVNDRSYARDSIDINISGTDRGEKYSIPIKIAISPQFDYEKGSRDLATIVRRDCPSFVEYGCIYYVLNATNTHEARPSIETYANKMGVINLGYGSLMPNFCAQMNLGALSRKYSSSGGPGLPRNVTSSDPETAKHLMDKGGRNKSGKRRTRRTDAKR